MYLIYSVAVCLTFIHRARGLPWYEEKVSLVGRGFLTMLWFWHVEMQILLLQVSKCLQMQKETTHSTFLWITCSTEFDYSSIIGSEDNYFKKEKKRQSNSPFVSLCCISSLLQITSSPKETIEKRLFYKRHLSLICRFSQHVPVFAWLFLYLSYVAPHTCRLVAMAAQPWPVIPPAADRGIYRQYIGSPVSPLWLCTPALWATIFSPM